MKHLASFVFSLALLFSASNLLSQSCELYQDYKEGSSTKMGHYDKKDKLTGYTTTTVKERRSTPGGFVISFEQLYDDTEEYTFTSSFDVICDNGNITVDMGNLIDPTSMTAYEEMEFTVEADDLSIPSGAKPGDKLNDGVVRVSVDTGTPISVNMAVTVSNRRITSREEVTTPAGTFNCLKIEYDMLTEVGFVKIRSSTTEYYNKKNGVIRTESFNKKGKLNSYTQVEEIIR